MPKRALAVAAAAAWFATVAAPADAAPDPACARQVDNYVHSHRPRPSAALYKRAMAKCEGKGDVKAALAILSGGKNRPTPQQCVSDLKRAMAQQRIPPKRESYQEAIDICRDTGDLAAAKKAVGAK